MSLSSPVSIVQARAELARGAVSSVDLTEACLDAIGREQPRTNAFTFVDAEGARAAAREADRERAAGVDRGPLHGIPISIKDLIDVAGQVTTAASRALDDRPALEDAPVVQRLRRAGAVLVGRTNLHEFALGTTSDESAFGPVRHPQDPSRSPGGSSGGSAVAVATGMGLASIGTDTGGSIRIPAAACGVVGLKPTFGRVPVEGVVPLSPSLDHVGPIARTVQDAAWVRAVLADLAPEPVTPREVKSLRLVRLDGYFADPLAPAVAAAVEEAIGRLAGAGTAVSMGSVSGAERVADIYVAIVLAEAAAWHAARLDARPGDYTPGVRARLERGRGIPAVEYLAALEARRALRAAVDRLLEDADALVLPTLPIVAPPVGATDVVIDPARPEPVPVRTAMLKHTQLFNLTGHPAISLPIPEPGLPAGLQLVGRIHATGRLLAVAAACERALARS